MRRDTSGFTLIEILVVITIIAALAGSVMLAVSYSQEKFRQVQCADRLRQVGMLYTADQIAGGGRPRFSGASHFLAMRVEGRIQRRNEQVLVCPGDPSVIVPQTPEDRDRYDDVDLANPSDELCSYVVRDFATHPIGREQYAVQAIAADRQGLDHRTAHHRGGINVLFSGGTVKFMSRTELGIHSADAIVVGPESPNEMLSKLVYGPGE